MEKNERKSLKRTTNIGVSHVKLPFTRSRKGGYSYNAGTGDYTPSEKVDKTEGIIKDGANNDFPLYVINTTTSSPTATACGSTYQRFLTGRGFNYEELNRHKINGNNQTGHYLKKMVARDMEKLRRVAVRVKYTFPIVNGRVSFDEVRAQLEYIPVKWVRYEVSEEGKKTGRFLYNPYFGTGDFNQYKDQTLCFTKFEPNLSTIAKEAQAAYNQGKEYAGQLWYYNEEPVRNGVYSFPEYFAAEDAILADIEINIFNFNNIINSFMISSVMVMQGDPNEEIIHPDSVGADDPSYVTRKELFEEQMSEAFSGAENAGKVMVLWHRNIEESAKFLQFPTNSNMTDQYVNTKKMVTDTIVTSYKIPNILANIETAGKLGASNEIRNAIKILNDETHDNRMIMEQMFNDLMPLTGFELEEDRPIEIVPIDANIEVPQWVIESLPIVEKDEFYANEYGIEIDRGEVVEEIDSEGVEDKIMETITNN